MEGQIQKILHEAALGLGISDVIIHLERPNDPKHGDYSSNVALIAAKKLGKNPRELAEKIVSSIKYQVSSIGIERIEVAGAGFVNFYLSIDYLLGELQKIVENDDFVPTDRLKNKKYMVEYAHPNTHKEMHIGHMRTLITGEAISRLLEASGATVFRANYQGDIGPHVAKAIWGIQQLMAERSLQLEEIEKWSNAEKAHFLGVGYARGSQEYEGNKEEIDALNSKLYQFVASHPKHSVISSETKESHEILNQVQDDRNGDIATSAMPLRDDIGALYQLTRQWSLDYYQDFYERFSTHFDRLFFESEMFESGKKIVTEHIGTVFKEENGAVIFPGEEYGLHTRVFITGQGNPTYEGKEMGNGFAEAEAFPFDMKVHVVASEQAGYFQVVFKALELIEPEKFRNKQHHVSMGMVTLTDRKMSSRTGDVLTVDWLLDQVKEKVLELFSDDRVAPSEKDAVAEEVAIAAVKHSVLRVGATQNVAFSIDKSVSLEGDSGPYLQYTYVRTQSVLSKVQMASIRQAQDLRNGKWQNHMLLAISHRLEHEELSLLRRLAMFEEIVERAALLYNPSIVAEYVFDLAQEFNLFYQKLQILTEGGERDLRLALTSGVGKTLKTGLALLGIKTPEKM